MKKKIIIISTADWNHKPWTNKQHMAENFARKGYEVLYVESITLRPITKDKKDWIRVRKRVIQFLMGPQLVKQNILRVSPPVIPIQHIEWGRTINSFILSLYFKYITRHFDFKKAILWVYNPFIVTCLHSFDPKLVIYHCVDDLCAIPNVDAEAVEQAEIDLVKKTQLVFTTSYNLFRKWKEIKPNNTYYLPNVADHEHFSKATRPGPIPEDLERIPRPRIGYIGTISDFKINFKLVAEVAKRMPSIHWVFIGAEREGQRSTVLENLKQMRNIHFLGYKEYALLPNYLRGIDIAVIPSLINQYTSSMFPMKFIEYLAAGLPVVSTPLPSLADFESTCVFADSSDAFVDSILKILQGNLRPQEQGVIVAKNYTWAHRIQEILNIIERVNPH